MAIAIGVPLRGKVNMRSSTLTRREVMAFISIATDDEMNRLFPPVFGKCGNCGACGICREVKSRVVKNDKRCAGCFALLREGLEALLNSDKKTLTDREMEFSALERERVDATPKN